MATENQSNTKIAKLPLAAAEWTAVELVPSQLSWFVAFDNLAHVRWLENESHLRMKWLNGKFIFE